MRNISGQLRKGVVPFLLVLIGAAILAAPFPLTSPDPTSHDFTIEADNFTFWPSTLRVNQGDTVTLRLASVDVVHGLSLDGYDLTLTADPGKPQEVTFTADKSGMFRFRCSVTCGSLHPFMIGELRVAPNLPLFRALALVAWTALAGTWWLWRKPNLPKPAQPKRIDLTAIPWVSSVLKSRWLQWSLMTITLVFFVLSILTGLFGTPAGNRNFAIIFVWIVWWALVILILVPLGGRAWCAMCPIPAPGEWLQRRSLVKRGEEHSWSRGWKWPRKLRNIWMQNGSFMLVALFSVPILTRPLLTGVALSLFLAAAIGLSLLYERRTFCRYLCPVGGFIGLYSMAAPLELRVKDPQVCVSHKDKECYLGSDQGYGCPWLVFPATLKENTYCGLCTECLKTCSQNNIALQLRPFGEDLTKRTKTRLDEAYKAFIMLTCAFAYGLVLLGPFGALKNAANDVGTSGWLAYAGVFIAANLLVVPGLFYAAAALGRWWGGLRKRPVRQVMLEYATALIPLGLAAWMAFSLGFVLVSASYVLPVLSDPFGWGWNLIGYTGAAWKPLLPGLIPLLQVPLLVGGLLAAINLTLKAARRQTDGTAALRAASPTLALLTVVTASFIMVFIG